MEPEKETLEEIDNVTPLSPEDEDVIFASGTSSEEAMKYLLMMTDWSPVVKDAFLAFTSEIVNFPSLPKSDGATEIVKMGRVLDVPKWYISAENERGVLQHLQRALVDLQEIVRSALLDSQVQTIEKHEAIMRAQHDLERAQQISASMDKGPKKEVLDLLFSLIVTLFKIYIEQQAGES